jgi:hypothetical protein
MAIGDSLIDSTAQTIKTESVHSSLHRFGVKARKARIKLKAEAPAQFTDINALFTPGRLATIGSLDLLGIGLPFDGAAAAGHESLNSLDVGEVHWFSPEGGACC